ncbi:MAG: type II secretion system F family protein [Candidatus Omnitrophica bacterium]|nr:type II secretion system F family protein [Candidatus Omnitrophota bacterium]
MNYDEFAFVNQQLAGMLQTGIPLEGALRQLCKDMRRGPLRKELALLEAALAKGTPFNEALAARQLPGFYVQMLRVGVQSSNLPAMLTSLADYYGNMQLLRTRLKGLLVYPLIVLLASLGLSLFLSLSYGTLMNIGWREIAGGFAEGRALPAFTQLVLSHPMVYAGVLFTPAAALSFLALIVLAGFLVPGWRRALRWRVPGFKEASLSQFARAMGTLLRGGCTLGDSIKLMLEVEKGNRVGNELAHWYSRVADGRGKFPGIAGSRGPFPPLFIWLVSTAGEELETGFRRASEIYYARATHRIDLFLQAILPVSIIALGIVIAVQAYCLLSVVLGMGLTFATFYY